MSAKSFFLVIAQFVLLAYLIVTGALAQGFVLLVIQGLGIAVALWGVLAMRIGNFNIQPEVRASTLVQSGPYRWIRNPMYLGILLFFGSSVITHFSALRVISLVLLTIVLLLKIAREETLLERHFGVNYHAYKAKTKKLIPFLF